MNLPNKLTLLRIILVPFFVTALLLENLKGRFLISLLIFIVASITDSLDGKIARKRNLETDFGKFTDPLADKLLVLSAFICFTELKLVPAFMVIIILARELAVTFLRLIASNNGKVIAANMWGKKKTVSQMITIVYILSSQCIKEFSLQSDFLILDIISQILLWIMVVLTLISGIIYLYQNRNIIQIKT